MPERSIYMDYNATTPIDPEIIGEIDSIMRRNWANPSSLHTAGININEKLNFYRENIASYFNHLPDGVHFCSSGTEAIHTALFGILSREKEREIISTKIEHSAIIHPLRHLKAAGKKIRLLDVEKNGTINLDELKKSLSNKKTILLYSPVNHETGGLQPIKEITKIARDHNCIVIIDGVQAASRLKPNEWTNGCDIFTVSGHKLYAPKGIAFLSIKKGIKIRPTRFGGYQENGIFPGTENTLGVAGLSAAISILKTTHDNELTFLKNLTEEGIDILNKSGIDFFIESPENRAPGVLCLSLPWVNDIEKLLFHLNNKRIYLSRFSACSPYIDGRSKILMAMGRPANRAAKSLRISLGKWSKRDDFYRLAEALKDSKNKNL